jgi:hypothetical protein
MATHLCQQVLVGKEWRDRGDPWPFTPYTQGFAPATLNTAIKRARRMVPSLSRAISERQLTPQFIHTWGLFCMLAGAIAALGYSTPGDMSSRRRGTSRKQDEHKIWFAHALTKQGWPHKTRKAAERPIVKHIWAEWDDGKKPWFGRFLISDRNKQGTKKPLLKDTFTLSLREPEIERLALLDASHLPPLPLVPVKE